MSLTIDFQKKLANINLDISFSSHNERVAILGVSGAGKSMLLKCLSGLETPDSGKIILNDKILFDSEKKINLPPQERKIAYFFQNYALFPHMSVYDNIKFVCDKENADQKTRELIKLFQLDGLENKYPNHISGGQQQRVALARIFAYNPDVILLDEPFSNLDINLKRALENDLLYYLKDIDKDILIVTHDYNEAFSLCDRVMIVNDGKNLIKPQLNHDIYKEPKYYEIATLFDCLNFSKIKIINEFEILAVDWDITLKLANPIKEDYQYIGVYNQDFKLNPSSETALPLNIVEMIDNVTNYKIKFKFNEKSDELTIFVNNHKLLEEIKTLSINTEHLLFLNKAEKNSITL